MTNTIRRLARFFRVAGRGVLGAAAGAVLASITLSILGDSLFSYYPPDDGFELLSRVAGVGTILGAAIGMMAGGWEIRGLVKHAMVGLLVGSVVGLFGGFAFGMQAAWAENGWIKGKGPAYERTGILVGVPAGAALGCTIGFMAGAFRQRGAKKGP